MRKLLGRKKTKLHSLSELSKVKVETKEPSTSASKEKVKPRLLTDLSKLVSHDNYVEIKNTFTEIKQYKSKEAVLELSNRIQNLLKDFAVELDLLGYSVCGKRVRTVLVSELDDLIKKIDSIKPKAYFEKLKEIEDKFLALDPKEPAPDREAYLNPIKDMFSDVQDKDIILSDKTKAEIIRADITFNFNRPLKDNTRFLLEKFGCQFAPYTNVMLWRNAQCLLINKVLFGSNVLHNIANYILDAISQKGKFITAFDISKETDEYSIAMIIEAQYSRIISDLVEASKQIHIHVK